MKPVYEQLPFANTAAVRALQADQPYFDIPWHYHPEFEITLITESSGTRFVGESVEPFSSGDLVILGSNLPHTWLNDRWYYEEGNMSRAKAVVIQFSSDLFTENLLERDECRRIQRLLETAQHGLAILDSASSAVAERVENIAKAKDIRRLTGLMELLHDIELDKAYRKLCSDAGSRVASPVVGEERIQQVITFMVNNYHRPISVSDAAAIINMNTSAFCRYFKKHTQRTFTQYLSELRINYACKLLLEGGFSISQACYECGFANQSFFNRQFRKFIGMTPREYIRARAI